MMNRTLKITLCFLFSSAFLLGRDVSIVENRPSEHKLRMTYYILETNFTINNRTKDHLKKNEKFLPLAKSAVKATLEHYSKQQEFLLSAIRSLYVEGNFYLRTEKFNRSYHALLEAKKICESYDLQTEKKTAEMLVESLAKIDAQLPCLYSFVLYHLGQLPLYDENSLIGIDQAELYLKRALEIQKIIDKSNGKLSRVADSNVEVGDVVIFERTLGYIYLREERFEEALELYHRILEVNDPFNHLITHRQLFKIYQRLGQKTTNKDEKINAYQKAITSATRCLDLIENDIGNYTRVSSVYKDIGNLYLDFNNPFQDINMSHQTLELANKHCPDQLNVTHRFVKEGLANVFSECAKRELRQAENLRHQSIELESIAALKYLKSQESHLQSYLMMGDLYLEMERFLEASAFYSNGSYLNSNNEIFTQKLALTESLFLKSKSIDSHPLSISAYVTLISRYKKELVRLRRDAVFLLEQKKTVESIYSIIGVRYKTIIAEMIEDLMSLLGPPPTDKFAFIAFGSLGKGFATPYSDLEFAILLNDSRHKKYFKDLSELLHIRINALGESPLASFDITGFDWLSEEEGPSPRGLTLDPWKVAPHFSLYDDFDLIGSPQEIARLFLPSVTGLSSVKKSMFYTFSLLTGDLQLVEKYQEEIDRILNPTLRSQLSKEIQLRNLDSYYDHISTWLKDGDKYFLKRGFYRPFTNVLDTLALKHGIHASSPWKILEQLNKCQVIDEKIMVRLIEAIDKIGLLRLKIYSDSQRQRRTFSSHETDEASLSTILEAIITFQNASLDAPYPL